MKVLIVEDNANLADVVRMGLSMEGMEAKAVYDGRDALEELNSGECQVFVLCLPCGQQRLGGFKGLGKPLK